MGERELPDQAGFALDALVSQAMEPMPEPISARELRSRQRNYDWYSVNYVASPLGWWKANIGTDHGPPELDDEPVRWITAREPGQSNADAWLVVEKMRELGWVYCTVQSHPEDAEASEWNDATMKVQWWAEFSCYRSPIEATSPTCDSPALAICLAALLSSPTYHGEKMTDLSTSEETS